MFDIFLRQWLPVTEFNAQTPKRASSASSARAEVLDMDVRIILPEKSAILPVMGVRGFVSAPLP